MRICNTEKCTGCSACFNTCTHKAIILAENQQGFLYPIVDETKCVKCNLCTQICPVNYPTKPNDNLHVYAALVKDDSERAKSSSGGIFACLAQKVIKTGGYVYGAVVDEHLVVRHVEAHSIEELEQQRNSKYVQSNIGLTYQQAKKHLKNGEQVLFSGTPCQIAGLRNYLKNDYPNLLTVDILCHGVPSPGMFRKYVKSEEEIAGNKMQNILFRSKVFGWKHLVCVRMFDNGAEADWGDTFVPGFLKNYFLRESCYSCEYTTEKRQGDITLGDYWGYHESAPDFIEDDDKGISLVIINTKKGQNAFNNIHKEIAFANRTLDDAKRGNLVLYKPCDKPEDYFSFWEDAESMNWRELAEKYMQAQDNIDWMSKELRDYYDIPFIKRHRKHKMKANISRMYHKIKQIGEKK
ncbi:MAG: Coenzyme F420 hydrogenase/dehydrogenase, beta subunit C-terminal domain [Ruminococcus sp.]|nr:Coenzyme F420 hydrogenase/dehydrogenase, beta subunit C-terminal domain [Ruminococcus sp.]